MHLLVLANLLDYQRGLKGQLTSWHEYESLDFVKADIDLLDERYSIGCRLASSILSLGDDVLSIKDLGNCLLLDW